MFPMPEPHDLPRQATVWLYLGAASGAITILSLFLI